MMMMRSLLAVALVMVFAGCDDGVTDPSQIVFPQQNVSFGRHVLPVLDLSCAFSGCHNSIDRAGDFVVESYVDVIRRPGMVHPDDSTGSVLWQIVAERLPHPSIPISKLLNANQQHGIAVWIQEGASNN
jgi:hypothetical protein